MILNEFGPDADERIKLGDWVIGEAHGLPGPDQEKLIGGLIVGTAHDTRIVAGNGQKAISPHTFIGYLVMLFPLVFQGGQPLSIVMPRKAIRAAYRANGPLNREMLDAYLDDESRGVLGLPFKPVPIPTEQDSARGKEIEQ